MIRRRRDPYKLRRLRQITQIGFFLVFSILMIRALSTPIPRKGGPLLVVAGTTVILTLILGRVWCGWVCPVNTVLDRTRFIGAIDRGGRLSDRWRMLKYVLLILIAIASFLGLLRPAMDWMGKHPIAVGISIVLLFAAIVSLNYIADLFWCRYLCPLGGAVAFLSKIAPMRRIVRTHCNDCAVCVDACAMGAIDPKRGFVNDPGECTVCFDCLTACTSSSNGFQFSIPRTSTRHHSVVET